MKQYEAVIKVMEENGGYATLGYLYERVLRVSNVIWKTKTPFASIRRIVQDERFFFKVKPGLWALKTYENKLPEEVLLLIEESKGVEEGKFTHSFYQGMIVEIGVLKRFKTYVPPQDQNRKFLGTPLKEIVDLTDIFKFTYDDVIRKTKSIDVLWFNERKFPSSAFEIEHTTDFKSSLLKFLELQDFNVYMYIVSPDVRKEEFLNKIDFAGFNPIKDRVKFLTYEEVSQWHSKSSELGLIESRIIG
jgi:hypothetical protein